MNLHPPSNHIIVGIALILHSLGLDRIEQFLLQKLLLDRVLLTRTLGHGRLFETFLGVWALCYGTILLYVPHAALDSKAMVIIAWYRPGWAMVIGLLLLLQGLLLLVGNVMNFRGVTGSQWMRGSGLMLVIVTHITYARFFEFMDALGAEGFVTSATIVLFSARQFLLAMIGLPRPGSPGRM